MCSTLRAVIVFMFVMVMTEGCLLGNSNRYVVFGNSPSHELSQKILKHKLSRAQVENVLGAPIIYRKGGTVAVYMKDVRKRSAITAPHRVYGNFSVITYENPSASAKVVSIDMFDLSKNYGEDFTMLGITTNFVKHPIQLRNFAKWEHLFSIIGGTVVKNSKDGE